MNDLGELFKNKNFILKLIALILLIIAVILWAFNIVAFGSYGYNHADVYNWMVIATATYVLILLVFVVVYVAGDTKRSFELWFMGCGCILNVIGGILELIYCFNDDGNFATFIVAAFMILAGVAMGIDFVLQVKE